MESAEFAIFGAGIAGSALAYHLSQGGAGPIALFEASTPAAGATGRAAGIVTDQLWDRWDCTVAQETRDEYAALAARHAPEAFTRNGFARFARDPSIAEALRAAAARLKGWGVRIEPLGRDRLSEMVPAGRFSDIVETLYGPDDAVVNPTSITQAYLREAADRGVNARLGALKGHARPVDGRWEIGAFSGDLRADHLVVAAGAWSKRLLAELGHPIPIAPYRTQAAVLRPASGPTMFPSVHDLDTDVYARPEENGRVLVGDGTDHVEADPDRFGGQGDGAFLGHVATVFDQRFPGWAGAEMVSSWAGVCTSTFDRHPIIGPVPGAAGLHVLTGFNGFGVMRAGGAARRLAHVLLGRAEPQAALGPAWAGRVAGHRGPVVPQPGFTLEAGARPRF
ncbi:MAG TPA: FAD-binding oxidoreductase [Thermoplasmata archaeon]|nr:FAD-binding oxidoreductase [Thermoplasmata archaeon]